MNELQQTRTLEIVAAEIRTFTASMLNHIIEIGRRMCEAKDMLPYGEFGGWIEANTGYSHSTANNFMRIFKEYGSRQGSLFGAELEDSQTFGKLSYSKALALLQLPSGEREEFVESHDVEAMSTRELQQAIRERDEALAQSRAAERKLQEVAAAFDESQKALEDEKTQRMEDADTIASLEQQIQQLENRPVEVAVQEPDPDEIERRAAELADKAKAEAEARIKELQEKAEKERDKLKEKLKAAEEKASAAEQKAAADTGPYKEEAEKARAEAEALRRQLAMSGEAMVTFKLRFAAWQGAWQAMREAMERIPEEQRERCEAAVKAQIAGWAS